MASPRKIYRDQLKRIRSEAENEELWDIRAHVSMPVRATPTGFLDEVVTNGVMRRTGGSIEFMHQSIRDYFAAVQLTAIPAADAVADVPPAQWLSRTQHPNVVNQNRSRLYEALIMCAGLMPDAGALIAAVARSDPALAAECLAAAREEGPAGRTAVNQACLDLMRSDDAAERYIGCQCVEVSRSTDPEIAALVEQIASSEQEEESTRTAAIRAMPAARPENTVASLMRLIGTTAAGTLAFDAVSAITSHLYGRPDYPLALGVLKWHYKDQTVNGEPVGLMWRRNLYELFLSDRGPRELVDIGLSSALGVPALTLLRLLHRSAGAERLLEIARTRGGQKTEALWFVGQLDPTEHVANTLRAMLEDRSAPFAARAGVAAALANIALQQDHRLSRSFVPVRVSWNVRRYLDQRATDRALAVHDRMAAAAGLSAGADRRAFETFVHRMRDVREPFGFRCLARTLDLWQVSGLRLDWFQMYEINDRADRSREYLDALLACALDDESEFLRQLAAVKLGRVEQEWAMRALVERARNTAAPVSSRRNAIAALAVFPHAEALDALCELLESVGEPTDMNLAREAARALGSSADAEAALSRLGRLIPAAPEQSILRCARSWCLLALERNDEGLAESLAAVELSPTEPWPHECAAIACFVMKRYDDALARFERLLEAEPNYVDVGGRIAVIAIALRQPVDALVATRRAARNNANAALNLGWFAFTNGDLEEAIAASAQAADLDPVSPIAVFNRGLALLAQSNAEDAIAAYVQAIDRCYAFQTGALGIVNAITDIDNLLASRADLTSAAEDIKNRLRECERTLHAANDA